MLAEHAVMDDGSAGDAGALVRLANAIQAPERFIALIGDGSDGIVDAAVAELEPAVGFIHLKNFSTSPLTLERILSEIGGSRPGSPETDLASVGHGLTDRAGARHRIVLILDQAQDLSAETLLFLQALPHSTARGMPVLKILFVANARFWTLIGSDLFAGIRERSAEPVILASLTARKPAACLDRVGIASAAPEMPEAMAATVSASDAPMPAGRSRYWLGGTLIGLAGMATLIAVLAVHSQTGTTADTTGVPASLNTNATSAIEITPMVTAQPVPTEPVAAMAPANPIATGAAQQDDLRQNFNEFLSSRSLTHLSTAQRERLFRQYLASRGQNPAVSRTESGK